MGGSKHSASVSVSTGAIFKQMCSMTVAQFGNITNYPFIYSCFVIINVSTYYVLLLIHKLYHADIFLGTDA